MRYLSQGFGPGLKGWLWIAARSLLLGLFLVGCSAEHKTIMRQGAFTRVITPEPPPFLTGPAALLLTNSTGFSARVDLLSETSLGSEHSIPGQLLGSGTKLLYAPDTDEKLDTHRQPGGYSFIWDTAQSRGYVLSEALQAYAPVVADLHVTNLQSAVGKASSQRLGGHPCESASVTAQMTDGRTLEFGVFRAIDLRGFPMQIQSQSAATPFTLTLSKLRFEPVSTNVFGPPDGFTAYPSAQAMADELAARQHNFRRKNSQPLQAIPEVEPRRY